MSVFPYPHRVSYADYAPTHPAISWALHLALVGAAIFAYWKQKPHLLFSIVFFYVAAIPSSRLMTTAAIAVPLAERFLYIPAAGMTVALARLIKSGLVGRRLPLTVTASAVVLLGFGHRTHERNRDWHSNLALFEAEYAAAPDSGETLRLLTGAYLAKRDYRAVVDICDARRGDHEDNPKFNNHCGAAYVQVKRYKDAEVAYRIACSAGNIGSVPHINLARLYLRMNRWDAAKSAFEKGIAVEENPARKHYRRGHMLTRLYPKDPARLQQAKAEFEAALDLQPGLRIAEVWLGRVNHSLGVR
jgi:hypothetical protein